MEHYQIGEGVSFPIEMFDRMSHYVVGKYFVNEPIIRLSYGHEWVFSGFVSHFRKIIDIYAFMKQSPDTPEKHKPFSKERLKYGTITYLKGLCAKTADNAQ